MITKRYFLASIFLISSIQFSCNSKRKADLIIFNGVIYTVNNGFSITEAMAVRNGLIVGLGSTVDIMDEFAGSNIVDLKGKPVYPGFIDSHCHFFGFGSDLVKCDLYGAKSFEEVVQRVSNFSKTNRFEWIMGRGWDQNKWEPKEFPDKEKLDQLFPVTPVYLVRVDGHAALCNQAALKLANIDSRTRIAGGEIIVKDGKLTGILIDNAMDLVKNTIPPFSKEMNEQALLEAQKRCFAVGLTTVDDAGLSKDTIQLIHQLQKSGQLKMRIYVMISDDPKTLRHFMDYGKIKTDRLNVGAIKMYADGSMGSRGACMKEPYSDQPGHYGFLLHTVSYFDSIASLALKHHFQLCTHAIGDSAMKVILQVYSRYLDGENDRRWRIEHCQVTDPEDAKMFVTNSVIPSVQPTHATSDLAWAEDRLGPERIRNAYAYRMLLEESGGVIAFGTDFPVENINPLYTFYAAVARKDPTGEPGVGFLKENRIKKKDALRAMTLWAAYANFEEEEKGSLEEGKFADFVILDQDILKIDDDDIPAVKVMATYLSGEKVY